MGDKATSAQRAAAVRGALEWLRHEYEATGNPLYLWAAIERCVDVGEEFPGWLRSYLAEAARTLRQHCDAPPDNPTKAVAQAFGFPARRGENSAFREINRMQRTSPAVARFCTLVLDGIEATNASKQAAREYGLSGEGGTAVREAAQKIFGQTATPEGGWGAFIHDQLRRNPHFAAWLRRNK